MRCAEPVFRRITSERYIPKEVPQELQAREAAERETAQESAGTDRYEDLMTLGRVVRLIEERNADAGHFWLVFHVLF